MKKCNICNEEKPLDEYYKVKRNKDGYSACCKSCFIRRQNRRRSIEYYNSTPEEQKKILEEETARIRRSL